MPNRTSPYPSRLRATLWTWGPVLMLMALIFVASAQPKHAPPPGSGDIYFSGAMPVFTDTWEFAIKKGSHVLGYGALGWLIMRGWRWHGLPDREAALLAILLATTYALTDEIHQGFVTGRNPSVMDIGFDYVGAALACLGEHYRAARSGRARPDQTGPPRCEDGGPILRPGQGH